jgi:hypothetical protein
MGATVGVLTADQSWRRAGTRIDGAVTVEPEDGRSDRGEEAATRSLDREIFCQAIEIGAIHGASRSLKPSGVCQIGDER